MRLVREVGEVLRFVWRHSIAGADTFTDIEARVFTATRIGFTGIGAFYGWLQPSARTDAVIGVVVVFALTFAASTYRESRMLTRQLEGRVKLSEIRQCAHEIALNVREAIQRDGRAGWQYRAQMMRFFQSVSQARFTTFMVNSYDFEPVNHIDYKRPTWHIAETQRRGDELLKMFVALAAELTEDDARAAQPIPEDVRLRLPALPPVVPRGR